ncbi:class I poly(R)-hydroxyalkanoic acid synthase [Microvirga sp. VF16]|uniref:class I poly(R)-hydroxyalkanoic acid synthase n=1 Tax=Microvirga sp. VF16 TaxID=2807101 RepID=UPI00193D9B7A|nr:class I poly(R)-hydroxyalkanoic acid synthase [Microvirga sp. VF16]QRM34577.1 class I poly(R)-hydroxyalkanoic acid synthase [Microvirga sp. VF16]
MTDPYRFAGNMARLVTEAGKAAAAYIQPQIGTLGPLAQADNVTPALHTFAQVQQALVTQPGTLIKSQSKLWQAYLDLWNSSVRQTLGMGDNEVAPSSTKDARFKDPAWTEHQFFDAMRQSYLITSHWAEQLVDATEGLDPEAQRKARFYMRQIINALAPSNWVFTNPELLRETFASDGENLVRGMQLLAEDIERGGGQLKIRQTDPTQFEVGRNLAITPGKVVYQNALMQLIQYAPTTEKVLKRPLLIVPPWINKFYILDLNSEKSFIRWAVDQGHSVFIISWINPDESLAAKSFEDYMREGILEALDAVEQATGETAVNAIGYCVGGTLLSATLAYMAAMNDTRIKSATFLTTQVDFKQAGDLKVFSDEEQIRAIERDMSQCGYLDSSKMATVFNLLRSNDLIWPYIVNVYQRGQEPLPFDLLYWNSDSTRMPAANHSFYLRRCYLQNDLSEGRMEFGGIQLDLSAITLPVYHLAAREDHIAPPQSVFAGAGRLGGPVTFVLAGSGHIAGVINPPSRGRYQYWTGGAPENSLERWLEQAEEHPGSWWPHWQAWVEAQDRKRAKARVIGAGKLTPIEDAPGRYVRAA